MSTLVSSKKTEATLFKVCSNVKEDPLNILGRSAAGIHNWFGAGRGLINDSRRETV
tara:strand:+ start:446 stop:613 length:168 start_codon:yes stop_codon:yes gene_type:complete